MHELVYGSPLHLELFGSGSQSLLAMQVVTLGPVSTSPGGQLIVAIEPTTLV